MNKIIFLKEEVRWEVEFLFLAKSTQQEFWSSFDSGEEIA